MSEEIKIINNLQYTNKKLEGEINSKIKWYIII